MHDIIFRHFSMKSMIILLKISSANHFMSGQDANIPYLCMSRLMGKPTICICEYKGADQLRGNREADQRLCFRYTDTTLSLLLKSEISSF